jgi:hypothetical protein
MADQMLRMAGRGEDGLAKAIKTDNDGYVLTKLSGNKIEESVVLSRSLKTSSVGETIFAIPNGAKGASVEATVFTASGTMTTLSGLQLIAGFFPDSKTEWVQQIKTPSLQTAKSHLIQFYPGVGTTYDAEVVELPVHLGFINTHLYGRFFVKANISGTFAVDEGFDLEIKVRWLL